MQGYDTCDWPTAEDESWAARVQLELAVRHHLSVDDLDGGLAVLHDAVVDSGSTTQVLFGSAETCAAELARDTPLEVRAAEPALSIGAILLGLGVYVVLVPPALVPVLGWRADLTGRGVAIVGVVTVVAGAAGLAARRWLRGRRELGVATAVAGVAVLLGGTAAALQVSPTDVLVTDGPMLLVSAVGLGLVALGAWLPERPAMAETGPVDTPEAYFTRLEGLLRGRHHLSAGTAATLTAQAREHCAAAGAAHPFDELGAPRAYALDLADQTPGSRRRSHTFMIGLRVVVAAVLAWQLAELVADGTSVTLWVVGGLLVAAAVVSALRALAGRRARRSARDS